MWLILLLLFCSVANADQKVYFDPQTNQEIIDVSGPEDKEQIIAEFNLSNSVKDVSLKEGEGYRVRNNEIEKYDIVTENNAIAKDKQDSDKLKHDSIKQKLGLSDDEFKDLKEALNAN